MATKKEVADLKAHYMKTLGNLPGAIRAMADYAPEALAGYTRMREYIYSSPPHGPLDLKTKELIYTLLDVVIDNLDGAKNHYNAAARAGLTPEELAQACMLVMAVCGIHTWGKTGYHLCDYAFATRKAQGKTKRKAKR